MKYDYESKNVHNGQIFGKIYLKAIRDGSREEWGEAWRKRGGLNFLMGRIRALPSSSLSCKPWSPIKSTLRGVLGLITIIILKRVRESDFIQSNKFTACKVIDGKEEAKSLMVFNLHKYKYKQMLFCKYTFECISNSIVFYLET